MRVFLALDLPFSVKRDLVSLYDSISGVRWIPESNLHLTLLFIGGVEKEKLSVIETAVSQIQMPPFQMYLGRVGTFPNPRNPSVLWVGTSAENALDTLAIRLRSALVSAGLDLEKRALRAHVTLGRVRRNTHADVRGWLQKNHPFKTDVFLVDAFQLYSSDMNPAGTRYRTLFSFPLVSD